LDGLLTSFFPQENVLAIFMILSLVVVMFGQRGAPRLLGAALLITLVGLSGSRTATAAAVVIAMLSLAIIYTKNRSVLAWVGAASGTVAAALFATSAILFFLPLDSSAFTGRGFIYELLRGFWLEQPVIGPGREVLEYAFSIGVSANYAISHEHGGMPYFLINGGLIVASYFSYWIFKLLRTNVRGVRSWTSSLCLVLAVTVAIVSVTEPVWMYDLRSPAFWSLALVSCSLFPRRGDTELPISFNLVGERMP
jgi:hypothetical protein